MEAMHVVATHPADPAEHRRRQLAVRRVRQLQPGDHRQRHAEPAPQVGADASRRCSTRCTTATSTSRRCSPCPRVARPVRSRPRAAATSCVPVLGAAADDAVGRRGQRQLLLHAVPQLPPVGGVQPHRLPVPAERHERRRGDHGVHVPVAVPRRASARRRHRSTGSTPTATGPRRPSWDRSPGCSTRTRSTCPTCTSGSRPRRSSTSRSPATRSRRSATGTCSSRSTWPDREQVTLEDRQAIVDLVIQYATGVDRRDWALYEACFTDPCEIDFSSWSGRPAATMPAAEWARKVRSTNGNFETTQHLSTNHVVTFESPDTATCVSYVQAQHWFSAERLQRLGPRADEPRWCTLGGYYTNSRRPHRRRLAHRPLPAHRHVGHGRSVGVRHRPLARRSRRATRTKPSGVSDDERRRLQPAATTRACGCPTSTRRWPSSVPRPVARRGASRRTRDQAVWLPDVGATTVPLRFTYSSAGPQHVELLQGEPGSVWDGTEQPGLHHVGLWSDDVAAETAALVDAGWTPPPRPEGSRRRVRRVHLRPATKRACSSNWCRRLSSRCSSAGSPADRWPERRADPHRRHCGAEPTMRWARRAGLGDEAAPSEAEEDRILRQPRARRVLDQRHQPDGRDLGLDARSRGDGVRADGSGEDDDLLDARLPPQRLDRGVDARGVSEVHGRRMSGSARAIRGASASSRRAQTSSSSARARSRTVARYWRVKICSPSSNTCSFEGKW